MIPTREAIRAIQRSKPAQLDTPLRNRTHTIAAGTSDEWAHKYPRQQGADTAPWLKDHKFWPFVGRIDNPYGDRNLVCVCPPMSEYA